MVDIPSKLRGLKVTVVEIPMIVRTPGDIPRAGAAVLHYSVKGDCHPGAM